MKNRIILTTILSTVVGALLYFALYNYADKAVAIWSYGLHQGIVFHISQIIAVLDSSHVFAIGLAASLFIVLVHDGRHGQTQWSKNLLYIVLVIVLASVLGGVFKYLLARYRPIMLHTRGLYGFHFFSDRWQMNSTPSGHTFRIFALMTALSMIWKRWGWIFIAVAILVGCSRIIVHAHYPSDVLFGAYVGIFSALWIRKYMYK